MIISSLSERQTFLHPVFISTPFYGYLKLLEATHLAMSIDLETSHTEDTIATQ